MSEKNAVKASPTSGGGGHANGADCGTPNPVTRFEFADDDAGREALLLQMAQYDCSGHMSVWLVYNANKVRYELFVRPREG